MEDKMFAIGLDNPGNAINVGHVLRAADAFGAAMVAITGNCKVKSRTDTSGAAFKIPVVRGTSLHDLIPHDCVPIAVELLDNAEDLCEFVHPHNAFYVFGSEGATLGRRVISWCKHVVYVPTRICLNLSACVNVVCYDRLLKERIYWSYWG
jgi:tRNA(Leu) C34 or U34 (ribose-2'-O)-methylase TrmL